MVRRVKCVLMSSAVAVRESWKYLKEGETGKGVEGARSADRRGGCTRAGLPHVVIIVS